MTEKKFAHEIAPSPPETGGTLDEALKHHYARAIGLDIADTDWVNAPPKVAGLRTMLLCETRLVAILLDALHQGMTGDEAWEWAWVRAAQPEAEWARARAEVNGIDPDLIKPYPCGPEEQR